MKLLQINLKYKKNRWHEWAAVTLFWCVLEGVFWGDSAAADGGNVRSVASRGERTISFWRNKRWLRNLHTQMSKTSGDFTLKEQETKTQTESGDSQFTASKHKRWRHFDERTFSVTFTWQQEKRRTQNNPPRHKCTWSWRNTISMNTDQENHTHLQMVNVLFCVQIYAASSFLDGHHRQTHIYTAMKLSFLNLTQEHTQ